MLLYAKFGGSRTISDVSDFFKSYVLLNCTDPENNLGGQVSAVLVVGTEYSWPTLFTADTIEVRFVPLLLERPLLQLHYASTRMYQCKNI